MKRNLIFIFIFFSKLIYGQITPVCTNTFYTYDFFYYDTIKGCNTGTPNVVASTSISLPFTSTTVSTGLALGTAFNFTAPNPTFWTVTSSSTGAAGTLCYYNGSTMASTSHTCTSSLSIALGSSKNYIYLYYASISQLYRYVYTYNGTSNPTLLTTITPTVYGDIVGDDQDNFYLLSSTNLYVYNSSGSAICSQSVTGLAPDNQIESFAIVGNTITAASSGSYYIGAYSASSPTINFVATPRYFYGTTDFASCPLVTTFSSSVTAIPNNTINCLQTLTLTASPGISPVSYTWSGPGITGSANTQSISVNLPGTYTCLISNGDCPPKLSTNTISIINSGGFFTPTVSSSGSLTCLNATTQAFVQPNLTPHTFLWSGPGIVGAANTPTIDLNSAGTYSVLVTNTLNGCSATKTLSVLSGTAPLSLSVSSSNSLLCIPSSFGATLTCTGANAYTWSPASSLNTFSGSQVIASPTISTTYTVNGQTGVCPGSTLITVTAFSTPTLLSTNNPTICSGYSTALSVNGASSYTWNPGNLNGASVTVSPLVNTVYTITGASNGCLSNTTASVTLLASPSISVSSPPYICLGGSATLNASGALSYTWSPGGMTTSSILVNPTVTTSYNISGTNANGCISSTTKTLNVLALPWAQINPATPTVCAGYSTMIFSSNVFGVSWSPGGSTNYSIAISPTVNTTYTLTISNASCSATAIKVVTVFPSPNLNVVWSNTNICTGTSITVSANGASSYTLEPGNLSGSTNTIIPYYTTTYTVRGSNGTCSNNVVQTVSVTQVPSVSSAATNSSICNGSTSNLIAYGAINYTWNPGGQTGFFVTVSPSVSTIYTVTGVNGICSNTSALSITVYQLPVINVGVSAFTICAGNNFITTATGATSYTWLPANVTGSISISNPTSNVTYTVIGEDIHACKSSSTASVIVSPAPQLTLSASHSSICIGSSATLNAAGATNYSWSPGGFTSPSITVAPTISTSYSLTAGNASSCTTNSVVTIAVSPNPTLITSISPATVCAGRNTTLHASGATNYTWLPGNVNGSSVTIMPTTNLVYTLTGQNATFCSDTVTLAINVIPTPTVVANVNPTVLCLGESATITVSGANTYSWNGASANSVIIATPTTVPLSINTLSGTDLNGCTSDAYLFSFPVQDCTGIDEFNPGDANLTIYPNPNTGLFTLQLNSISDFTRIEIYNSTGELVLKQRPVDLMTSINFENRAQGIYLVVIRENTKPTITSTLIKN